MMDIEARTKTYLVPRTEEREVELPLYGRVQDDISGLVYTETFWMIDSCKAVGAELTIAAGSVVGARLYYSDRTNRLVKKILGAAPQELYPARLATRKEFVEQLAQVRQWIRIEAGSLLIDLDAARTRVPVLNEC